MEDCENPKGVPLGGVGGGRTINWVRWSLVCKPKKEGGLSVQDVRVVNLSLWPSGDGGY